MRDQLELMSTYAKVEDSPGRSGLPSVTVGRLIATDPEQGPMVDFAMNHSGLALLARTLVPLDTAHVGSQLALVFEDGEITRPIILGVMQEWNPPTQHRLQAVETEARVQVKHDDESLLLTAAKEITLQCGKASITLTSAGKVLLRGAYLLSRSSGVNRIKGGSVQIN
jgi:hypothetical protein